MLRPQPVNAPGVNGTAQKLVHFILWVGTFLGIPGEQRGSDTKQADHLGALLEGLPCHATQTIGGAPQSPKISTSRWAIQD